MPPVKRPPCAAWTSLARRWTTPRRSPSIRDQSWHTPRVFDLLRKHNVAFCIFELGGIRSVPEVTADFVYVRLHGPGNKYQGDYSTSTLKTWAVQIDRWISSHGDVYVYFDNDQAGYAVKNARELKRMIRPKSQI